MSDCYRGWEIEIRNFRQKLKLELEDSHSLKSFVLEILNQKTSCETIKMIIC